MSLVSRLRSSVLRAFPSMTGSQEHVKVPTLEEIQANWNAFAPIYNQYLERTTNQGSRSLFHNLDLSSASKILEVSCGPGSAALEMISVPKLLDPTKEGFSLVATDLSDEMVKIASKRLSDVGDVWKGKIMVKKANAQELEFLDASFDRYVSNLSLHIVPEPDKMLLEAFRVLTPGGKAGFSVWGRRENSPLFTLIPTAIQNVGLSLPPNNLRSQFHLGQDLEKLRQRVLNAGFTDVMCWYQSLLFESFDIDFIVNFMTEISPGNKSMLRESFDDHEISTIQAEMKRILLERKSSGLPFGFEAILIIARK